MPHLEPLLLSAAAWLGDSSRAAKAARLPFDTYSGYYVANTFEPDLAESFLVIFDQKRFDEVFGVAFVMGDTSHRLAENAFDSLIVLAAIKRGKRLWDFKAESVTLNEGNVELRYTAKQVKTDSESTTFACPLIVSIPKGPYTSVTFIENGKTVKVAKWKATKRESPGTR